MSESATQPRAHGTWHVEVRFVDGPMAGAVHTHDQLLLPDGTFVMLAPRVGAGRWTAEGGDAFSYAFYEVIVDAAGAPTNAVRISAHALLSPDGQVFTGSAEGTVFGLGGAVLASNHTDVHATRAGSEHGL